jgi:hypothetical protein
MPRLARDPWSLFERARIRPKERLELSEGHLAPPLACLEWSPHCALEQDAPGATHIIHRDAPSRIDRRRERAGGTVRKSVVWRLWMRNSENAARRRTVSLPQPSFPGTWGHHKARPRDHLSPRCSAGSAQRNINKIRGARSPTHAPASTLCRSLQRPLPAETAVARPRYHFRPADAVSY